MLGAIAGDVTGSTREWEPVDSMEFELFEEHARPTDDSILTLAVASWLLGESELVPSFKQAFREHPHACWGGMFAQWAQSESAEPYNSLGNGSAMRVAPVGFAFGTMDETLEMAERSAVVTHDHPEGIKGAQATAAAIFLARTGRGIAEIREELESRFGYDLSRPYEVVREEHTFDETCPGSVPEAIIAFLSSTGFEDAVRRAIALGGDADTQACIAGGIAGAFYGVPDWIRGETMARLTPEMVGVVARFEARYGGG